MLSICQADNSHGMSRLIFSEKKNKTKKTMSKYLGEHMLSSRQQFNIFLIFQVHLASVAHLDAPSDWRPGGRGFNPRQGWQHSFVEIDHEIFSMVILSLPLIQEGQLSVSGRRMCTILVNRLED